MQLTRRTFLAASAAITAAAKPGPAGIPLLDGVPRVDYHAHPESGMTVEAALALSNRLGVKLGLVEHAGVKPDAGSNLAGSDAELNAWIDSLEGKPAFCGIQAERLNWASAFSKQTIARLDYVLTDALTAPDESGKPVRLWVAGFQTPDPQKFMDRYVDHHLAVLASGRVDILANPTFLPEPLAARYDELWTERRMTRIVEGARKHGTAIEINERYRIPGLRFLQMAKAAGLKFSFGSNMHTAEGIGRIDWCVSTYKTLGLTLGQFFVPRQK